MSNQATILPNSIAVHKHLEAFDVAVAEHLQELPIGVMVIYALSVTDSRALYYLAWQFDVLGKKGWNLCNSDDERRELIRGAIELHRKKGTPWAIRESLKRVGFNDVVITEGVNGHWARFSLRINNQQITLSGFNDIVAMVEEYKPVRSVLDSILVTLEVTDEITLSDLDQGFANEQLVADDTIYLTGAAFYNGNNNYDGTIDHSGEADVVIIT